MRFRLKSWTTLAALALALAGCSHSGTEPAPPPPPPVPPPPPPPSVRSIAITPSGASVVAGQTVQLSATAKDSAGHTVSGVSFTWASANESFATVSGSGLVTGVNAGTARISATAGTVSASVNVTVTAPAPQNFSHVFLVVLENRDYLNVIGSSQWPYLNRIANQYAYATQYSGVTHPSVGNYFMLTTGDTVTNNDNWSTVINNDNIVRHLLSAGKTWTSYAEDLPSVGYLGPDQGTYTRHHNPFVYFSDVANSTAERQHLKQFSSFASDLAAGNLTNLVYIVPNSCNDGHDCTDAQVDAWLQANIDPILHNAAFANSAVIITFDESETFSLSSANAWRVPFVFASPRGKTAFTAATTYTHAATLRFMLQLLGVNSAPGQGASAPSMSQFLK